MVKKNRNYFLYLNYIFFSTINIFSSYQVILLNSKFNITISLISTLLLIDQAIKFIFEIPTGFLSDKYGRKKSSITGNMMILIGNFFLFGGQLPFVIIYFILKSLGTTFVSGSFESMVVDGIDKDNIKKLNSSVRLVFFVGVAISMILGGFIINIVSIKTIILFDIIFLIVSSLLIVLAEDENANNSNNKIIKIHVIIKQITSSKVLLNILVFDFITAFSFVAVEDFYSAFLNSRGVSTGMIGIIISLQLIVSAFLGYLYLRKKRLLHDSKVFQVSSVLLVIATMLIYFDFVPLLLIPILYLVSDISFSILGPIKYELFQNNITSEYRSTILSLRSLLIAGGGSLSFLIISIFSQYQPIEVIMPMLLFITLIVYIIVNIKLRKSFIK